VAVLRRSGVGAQKVAEGKRLKTGGYAKALAAEIKGRNLVRHDNAFRSRYKGVCWHKKDQAWIAQFQHGGKKEYLGFFATDEEAKARYDARCLELGVDPNTATASGFRGVTWDKINSKWKARIKLDGKGKHLGFFEATTSGEVDAALAYDAVARAAGRPKAANFQLQAATAPSKVLEEDVHASDFAEESTRDHLHVLRDHLHALPAADHATLLLEAEFRPAAPAPAIQGTPVNPHQAPVATNCWATAWHDDEDEEEDEDEGTTKGTGKHYTA
jgi:hypothetical protein